VNKFLFSIFILNSCFCFSNWENRDFENKSVEEIISHLEETDCVFFNCDGKKSSDNHIVACCTGENELLSSFVILKCDNGKVGYQLYILEQLCKKSYNLYLELLDKDGFLINRVNIGKFNANFTGSVIENFSLSNQKFKDVKRYHFRYTDA